MKQKFTNNHLLQFLYKETSASQSLAIKDILKTDWNLREQHVELVSAYRQLPKVTFQPSKKTIQNILQYSQATAVQAHH